MVEGYETLRAAFEDAGYTVDNVTENRDRVRIVLQEDDAEADLLRELVHETLSEERVFALNVGTENVEGAATVQTVVSFRDRS
jgi:acetylornithine/succinyldiaminopimelate/putrescine aminotransferase